MAQIENWARPDISTLQAQIKKLTEPCIRDHVLLAMMRKRGRISYGHSGKNPKWRVKWRRFEPLPNDDMDTINAPRRNRYKEAELPWRSYRMAESYSKYETLVNQGKWALIKIVSQLAKDMAADANEYFAMELYRNGDASGYTDRIHGLESVFTEADAAISASNTPCLAPSGTSYGGLNSVLGTYGGSWTTYWPLGTGPMRYHFWSPMIIDHSATFWPDDSDEWKYTWQKCLRFAEMYQMKLHKKRVDLWLMDPELERQAKDSMLDKERVLVNSNDELKSLGFGKAWNWEGTPIMSEYGCTADSAYGINWSALELKSMQKQLFATSNAPEWDVQAKKLDIDFWGNLFISTPAHLCKITS
jgi:hypothetical protein